MSRILIIEDRQSLRTMLSTFLKDHTVLEADSAETAETMLIHFPEIVLCDLRLPGMDGLTFIRKFRDRVPEAVFIVMTAYGDIPTAVEAMKSGAYDFLPKPLDLDHLAHIISRTEELIRLRKRAAGPDDIDMVGRHPTFQSIKEQANKMAQIDLPLLITGESGTGKEVLARWIHQQSNRRQEPFVTVNCAAVPDSMLEAELFGHEAGAFTGADRQRKGFFERASSGTLFLDEIAGMNIQAQSRLLRVVENGEYYRVGSNVIRISSARLIFASNQDLNERTRAGLFREDLFHRIRSFTLTIPPLRERKSDIPLLARHFARLLGTQIRGEPLQLTDPQLTWLKEQSWPGNIRQLRNVIERWIILGPEGNSFSDDVPDTLQLRLADHNREELVEQLEDAMIRYQLARLNGNKSAVSEALGMSYKTLLSRMKKLGID